MIKVVFAFTFWGLYPIYFKMLQHIPPMELLVERIFWTAILLLIVLIVRKQWTVIKHSFSHIKIVSVFVATALLITFNWGIFMWAVMNNRIIDASFGYFISPLLSIVLGTVFLKEKMSLLKWLSVGLVTVSVLWLIYRVGIVPWIGISIGLTFSLYGLLRKTTHVGATDGLALETIIMLPVAVGFMWYGLAHGTNAFWNEDSYTKFLIILSGPLTALPLILFAAGAKEIALFQVGLIQYIAPTLQFLIGVFVFHEAINHDVLVTFILIWIALGVITADSFRHNKIKKVV